MTSKRQDDDGKSEIQNVRKKFMQSIRKKQHNQIFQEKRKEMRENDFPMKIETEQIQQQIQKQQPDKEVPEKAPELANVSRMNIVQSFNIYNYAQHFPSVFAPLVILPQPEQPIYFQQKGLVIYKTLLGKGAASNVWLGKIRSTGQKIAAKQVKILEINQLKCLRELESQHILKIIDILEYSSKTFIILQYCDRNLREELKACNYEFKLVMKYFQEILQGMSLLQQKNIIHRDLKFENILVKDGKIKIADFGLAKFLGEQLQVESRRCGTPYTMAPQIFLQHSRGLYSIKSDIWAIGIILHQMLYQLHPFTNKRQFIQKKRVQIKKNYGVLDKIIDECLQFSPSYRIGWQQLKKLFSYYLQDRNRFFIKHFGNPHTPQSEKEKQYQQQKRKRRQQRRKDHHKNKQGLQKKNHHRQRTPERQRKFEDKKQPDRNKYQLQNINKRDQWARKYRYLKMAAQKPKETFNQIKKTQPQPQPKSIQNNQILQVKEPEKVINKPKQISIGETATEMVTIVGIITFLYYFFC